MPPVMWDLGCGRGGWSRGFLQQGWRCIGFDLAKHAEYPGEFVKLDVRELLRDLSRFPQPDYICASMPCDEFARWGMPWTLARRPPVPSLELWDTCWQIGRATGANIVQENVRAAQRFVGPARTHFGPFYLWGDVPAILPYAEGLKSKELFTSADKAKRAEIPLPLSRWLAVTGLSSACEYV